MSLMPRRSDCAGVARYAGFLELEAVEWHRMYAVNVLGTVLFTREVLGGMIARQGGTIINLSSRRGIEPKSATTAYSASKAAVLALSRALAEEVSEHGIKVTYLAPGGTKTGLSTPKDERFLDPSAIAEAIVYVCETGDRVWVRDLAVLPLGL